MRSREAFGLVSIRFLSSLALLQCHLATAEDIAEDVGPASPVSLVLVLLWLFREVVDYRDMITDEQTCQVQ